MGFHRRSILVTVAACATLLFHAGAAAAQSKPRPPKSPRLYIFDCGLIKAMPVTQFGFKEGEVAPKDFVVPCYLIVHPKGTLIWDVGVVPDSAFPAGGGPATQGIMSSKTTLLSQLAAVGYKPSDIDYLAFSHYHIDHTANANEFAGSAWLTPQNEKDAMFAEPPPKVARPENYSALKNSKTIIIKSDEYDVFGDGTVIIKAAPGHTPGHQTLLIRLKKTGPVLLAGDLYHYPEERTLNRFPIFEFDAKMTAESRKNIDAYVKKTGAQLWIEHDQTLFQKLKKSPAYYE